MKKILQELVSDTLVFIRQEELFPERKKKAPTPIPQKKIAKERVEREQPKRAKLSPPAQTKKPPLLFETIQKHLPHIKLTEKIPEAKSVLILLKEDDDLRFFQNLAKAIEDRFCPVTIRNLGNSNPLASFTLILTQETVTHLPQEKQILIAKREKYENNTLEKKLLWSKICEHLSPKSF